MGRCAALNITACRFAGILPCLNEYGTESGPSRPRPALRSCLRNPPERRTRDRRLAHRLCDLFPMSSVRRDLGPLQTQKLHPLFVKVRQAGGRGLTPVTLHRTPCSGLDDPAPGQGPWCAKVYRRVQRTSVHHAAMAPISTTMVASALLPIHFPCPACHVANAVLAYHDHWKRVFLCLDCRHLWNAPNVMAPSLAAPQKPAAARRDRDQLARRRVG